MILSNVHCQSILSLQLDCKNINTKSIFLLDFFWTDFCFTSIWSSAIVLQPQWQTAWLQGWQQLQLSVTNSDSALNRSRSWSWCFPGLIMNLFGPSRIDFQINLKTGKNLLATWIACVFKMKFQVVCILLIHLQWQKCYFWNTHHIFFLDKYLCRHKFVSSNGLHL